MKTYLKPDQADAFRKLEASARAIENALESLMVDIAQSSIPDADKIGALNWLSRADTFRGFSYALHPQAEWQGGETWKTVKPDLSRIQKP